MLTTDLPVQGATFPERVRTPRPTPRMARTMRKRKRKRASKCSLLMLDCRYAMKAMIWHSPNTPKDWKED